MNSNSKNQTNQTHTERIGDDLRCVLADLRAASTAVAEHHRRHAPVLAAKRSSPLAIRPLAAWSLAASALIVCIAAPLTFHRHPAPATAVAIAAAPQPAPAVSDEVLLADVQADLNASVPDSMLPLTEQATTATSNPQRKEK